MLEKNVLRHPLKDEVCRATDQWGSRAHAVGTKERIPEGWRFSEERLHELLYAESTSHALPDTLIATDSQGQPSHA